MTNNNYLIPLVLAVNTFCVTGPVKATTLTEANVKNPTRDQQDQQDQNLKSLSPADALARFGPAIESEDFDLKPEMPEFRNQLPDLFDSAAIRAGNIRIRELTWSLTETQNRTIWFVSEGAVWKYLDHVDWDKGSEF